MNKVVLSGRLSKEVELRHFQGGGAVANFSLALNRRVKQNDGSYKDEASFVEIKLFGRTAEVANQFLVKGSRLLVEGRLQQETWQDASGQNRSKIVVVGEGIEFLDTKQDGERELAENHKPAPQPAPKPRKELGKVTKMQDLKPIETPIEEEVIPF